MKKLTLFLVAMTMSLFSFAAQPKRIYAYDLSSTLVDKVYTFSFTANETPTSGKIIFYDATSSELVGEIALTNPVLGKNDVEIAEYNLPGKGGQQLNWAVELSAAAVTAYEKIYEDAASKYCRGYSNVDVSPESDHFGSVYVGDRVSNVANSKFYVYSPVYSIVKSDGYDLGADNWGFGRFAIASDGTLWLTDYTDNHSGMFLVNPNDLTTSSQFFAGTRYVSTAPEGVIKNGDIETGSSLACATFYGEGANTKLVTVAEDYKNKSFPVAVFNVGNADGTLKTRWETAPDILFSTGDNAAQNFDIKACEKGVWVAQSRSDGNNASGAASLCFYAWDGTCTWKSYQHTDIINGSLGGGIAITPDEKQLIMKIEGNTIAIFDIAWNGTTPTLTKTTSFDCKYPVISSINLDYAGNIVTAAGTGGKFAGTSTPFMRLAVYSNPTNNNTCEVPAKKADVVTKKTSRAWAYDLELSSEGDSYTFSFMAATSADATLIFNQDGVEVGTINCGHVSAGLNTITKTHDELLDIIQKSGDFNWSVRMIGEDIVLNGSYLTELTAAGQGLDFYLPQGLVVDNNPESETFSTLFIAEAQGGTLSVGPTHKQGIYHYSQKLAELNPTDQGIIPSNVTLTNGSRQEMHRIAINPKNNHVALAHNISGKPAVWSVPANNPAGEATNLIAGTAITMPNSICFDENGVLYVMDNANATTGGTLYKVVDGVATKIAQNTIWQHSDNSLAYDGRGGIWIAQSVSNNTWPSYEILSHINSEGNIDWKSSDYKSTALFSNGNGDGYSKRGQVAYSMKDDLLVFGGNCRTHIFQVTYDANTGIPSLGTTYKYRTPFIGGSKSTANIDGLSFDYAGDLYVMCATRERLYKYVVPTNNNTCTTPAKKSQVITLVSATPEYNVTISVNGNGTVTGANTGTYLEGTELTLTATPAEHHRFVNWTKGVEIVSTEATYSFAVTENVSLTATFEAIPQYTITVSANDGEMGSVTGGGDYYEGATATLTATAKGGYVFEKWSDDNTDNPRTITVGEAAAYTAIFKVAVPRAWAYDLRVDADTEPDNYIFTFKATSAGDATLLFADKDGNELVAPHAVGTVAAGVNTVTLAKTTFESVTKDVYWSVKMDGEAITRMAELTNDNNTDYHFWMPTGVAVDNNPESPYFGQFYIASPRSGEMTEGGGNGIQHNAGVYVFDQTLKLLNETKQQGYLPSNVKSYVSGTKHMELHRIAVNPVTHKVAFTHQSESVTAAVWNMDPANMEATATNLIDGASITKSNSLCFDENGVLYVANFTDKIIYMVKDGVVNTFGTSAEFVQDRNSITSDGRGGLWVAQNRGQDITEDGYARLMHFNAEGTLDYKVDKDSPHGFTGTAYRGAVAYNTKENILAFGANNVATLYQVTFDAETGVPSLEPISKTPSIGTNIDGLAFDYAGDLYVTSASVERLYKFVLPTNDNTCTVPAPESQVIKKEVRYTVTVNVTGNGEVEGDGEYVAGATAELRAVPAINNEFVNWTLEDASTSIDNPLTLTVNSNITITANFAKVKRNLTLRTNDVAKGTVSGAGSYDHGTDVEITATPKAGYKLLYWSDRSTENPRTITMTKNEAISAYFVKDYADEPTVTITKMWENTNVPASTNNGYQAVGWDGKIYMKDRLNASINVYTETGSELYAQLGAAVTGLGGDQPIAVDNAGNLIVRSGSGEFHTSPVQVTILKKDETTGKTIDFTLPATGRCDFISASGDIYSEEGGYVYFYCQNQTTVSRLYIKNGGASAADISVDKLDNATLTAGSSQSHVFTNIFGDLMTHTRDNNYKVLQEVNVLTGAVSTMNLPNFKKSTLGGCSFELGGKEFIAYNIAGTDYNSEWNLYNMTDKEFVSAETLYAKDRISKKTSGAANWLNVQVVDEETAYIYQFCPEVAVAVWKVSIEVPKYTRTVTNGDYGTICLPYGSNNYNGAEFYEIAYLELEADGTTPKGIWLDEVTELEAGKPYIFKATADELVVYYEGEEALSPVEGKAGLTGTFEGISHPNDILEGNYMIANNKFWLCGTGCWLNANRAYIKHDALHASTTPVSPMPGRRRVYMGGAGENSATGTEDMIVPNQQVQKVIENGQLIIIRDGVKYNVQGVRL